MGEPKAGRRPRLSPEEWDRIAAQVKAAHAQGEKPVPYKVLARQFGLGAQTIWMMLTDRKWQPHMRFGKSEDN